MNHLFELLFQLQAFVRELRKVLYACRTNLDYLCEKGASRHYST